MDTAVGTDFFAIPEFWRRSTWQQEPTDLKDGFFNLKIEDHDGITFFLGSDEPPADDVDDVFFTIPAQLRELRPDLQDDNETEQQTTVNDTVVDPESTQSSPADNDDDPWLFPDETSYPPPPKYTSWAAFEHTDLPDPIPLFASEEGPDLLDALIASDDNSLRLGASDRDSLVVQPRAYYRCLLAVALGRSSALFSWSDEKRCFVPLQAAVRIPGLTGPLLRSVEKTCLECGTYSRALRNFVDVSFTSATAAAPSRAALARAVDHMLIAIQSELGVRGQKARSLLQLQALIRPAADVVRYMRGLVSKLSRSSANDGSLLSTLFQEAQSMEHGPMLLREVVKEVLQMVSEPWLGFVAAWTGLDPESKNTLWADGMSGSKGKAFVRLGDRVWMDDMGDEPAEADYFLDENKMPTFVPDEMAQALFETGRNLRFLWTNHPEHAFSDPATFVRAGPPPLRWQFDWQDIAAVEQVAKAYELAVLHALASYRQGQPSANQHPSPPDLQVKTFDIEWRLPSLELQPFGKDDAQIAAAVQASLLTLDTPKPDVRKDDLTVILQQHLFDEVAGRGSPPKGDNKDHPTLDDFPPHWSLLPLLSFGPVVSVQARLVSRECMRLLFSAHNVREQLAVLRAFPLLGNGGFCSRLSHALFDPDLAAAEAKTGVRLSSGGLGLRLSNRESWPPASSELRLALMGVLVESYTLGSMGKKEKQETQELPGGMSFAVRELEPEEMERCMDPDSLEALDFLRLTYKPPSALMAVITPTLLSRYDTIFRLLLRVLRMYYAVNQLSGGARGRMRLADDAVTTQFRFEAHHFVSVIMAYFLDSAVGMAWQRFANWLDDVEGALERDDTPTTTTTSPDRLRERHEQAVDEMLGGLFLRKRQQPLLELLESIFGLILDFAKTTQGRAAAAAAAQLMDDDTERAAEAALQQRTARLYATFSKKVAVFLTVCRGLSEKEADSAARHQQRTEGGSLLPGLLLMLDYNGVLSSTSGR